jgi:hypothetical protein
MSPLNLAETGIGKPFGGGFLGAILPATGGKSWAVIVSPKAQGEKTNIMWGIRNFAVSGARSFTDGFANSEAMNDDLHLPAKFCRSLRIGGKNDWYWPSCGELAALWANLGPNHTLAANFAKGAPEAFDLDWYWSSTEIEDEPNTAWGQPFLYRPFGSGVSIREDKYTPALCRAVRRELI